MTKLGVINRALAGMAMCLAASAFAASSSLHIYSPTSVAGEKLEPGVYTVQWDGTGPNVELKIMHGKRVVVAAPGVLKELKEAAANDTSVLTVNRDGSRNLWQIFFSGQRYSLEINQQQASNIHTDRNN